MTGQEASDLVNAVTGYALVLAGLLTLALALLMTRQPWRWLLVYLCVAATGVAAVWYHGLGGSFPARVADIGTNLMLAWAIQLAIVGDYYPGRGGRLLNLVIFLANLEYILTFAVGGAKGQAPLVLASSQFGGLNSGEILLVVNCLIAVALLSGGGATFSLKLGRSSTSSRRSSSSACSCQSRRMPGPTTGSSRSTRPASSSARSASSPSGHSTTCA